MFKKALSLILIAAMLCTLAISFASCGDTADDLKGMSASPLDIPAVTVDFTVPAEFKIGFICLHDESSTYDLNFINGVLRYQQALGLTNEQVIIKRNVPETEECYTAAIDLVAQGCNIIFANSFGHEPFISRAAAKNAADVAEGKATLVQFCHATGVTAATATYTYTDGEKEITLPLDNFQNAFASIYQGRYLAGIAAGLKLNEMIKEGKITAEQAKIGYVGAYPYAEVISGYSSFYLGAKSVCPSVTMDVQFTGSWYDVNEEKNAAEALIARNCVLISQHADSMGAPGACEAAGVPNVSYNGSTYDAAPNTFIVSSAINWTPYYVYITKCFVNGEDIKTDWCGGIAEGSVVLTGINLDVAAEGTLEAINDAIAKFKAGTLNVFDTANFTVDGAKLEHAFATDTNGDFVNDKDEAVFDGYYHESYFQSAPSFAINIDGITRLN